MSADRWGECPQCAIHRAQAIEDALKAAAEAYGKVSVHEWMALNDRVTELRGEEVIETLREGWDVGIHEDRFEIDYYASCLDCGFNHGFKSSAKVTLKNNR